MRVFHCLLFISCALKKVSDEAPMGQNVVRTEHDDYNASEGAAAKNAEVQLPPANASLPPSYSKVSEGNTSVMDWHRKEPFESNIIDSSGLIGDSGQTIDDSSFVDGCDVYEEEYEAVDVDTHAATAAALNSRNGLRDAALRKNSRQNNNSMTGYRFSSQLPESRQDNLGRRRNAAQEGHISDRSRGSRSNNRSSVAPLDLPLQRARGSVSDCPNMDFSPPNIRPEPPPVLLPPSSPSLSASGLRGPSSPHFATSPAAASPGCRRASGSRGTPFEDNHSSTRNSRFTFDEITSSGVALANVASSSSSATSPASPSERPRRSLGTTRLAMREARSVAAVDEGSNCSPSFEVGPPLSSSFEPSSRSSPPNLMLQSIENGPGRRHHLPLPASPASPARSSTSEREDSREDRWNRWQYRSDSNESDERDNASVDDAQNGVRKYNTLSPSTFPFAAAAAQEVYDEVDAVNWNKPEAVRWHLVLMHRRRQVCSSRMYRTEIDGYVGGYCRLRFCFVLHCISGPCACTDE